MAETPWKQEPEWVLWSAMAVLLIVPLVAMQFTDELKWTCRDFGAAAVPLAVAGLSWEFLRRRTRGPLRAVVAAMLFAVVVLIWAKGAVGILH